LLARQNPEDWAEYITAITGPPATEQVEKVMKSSAQFVPETTFLKPDGQGKPNPPASFVQFSPLV
jgi:hypothetical protein